MKGGKRHVPLRTCIVCDKRFPTAKLMRIVATGQGNVGVDTTRKLQGRGAYVCEEGECLKGPLKKSRFEYALRTRIMDEDWERVAGSIKALVPNEEDLL